MSSDENNLSEENTQAHSKKTEKVIVAIALFLLLVSLGSLYFDDWLWSGLRSRGDSIGMITSRTGDVRLKFDQEVSWLKATTGQSLQYNDSVFAGPKSEADIKLGESQLTVSENSLVVLRREMDANFLNLNFGTLFGRVAKNDKVYIDTGAGQPTLLKTTSEAQIVLKKVGDQARLEVVKGVAEIEVNGVKKTISKDDAPITLPSAPVEAPPELAQVVEEMVEEEPIEEAKWIEILPPSPVGTLFSKEAREVKFQWSYGGETRVPEDTQFEVEFANEPGFHNPIRKFAQGTNEVSVYMARSNDLFYRVKGPKGEVSPVNQFGFVRMFAPKVIAPTFDQEFSVKVGQSQAVSFALRSSDERPLLRTQIAADPEFQTVLAEQSGPEQEWVKELPSGQYYVRAQAEYEPEYVSDWSQTTYFKIKEERPPTTHLPRIALHREAIIQNLSYPSHLYSASDEEVKSYLKDRGFMREFFVNLKDHYDQLAIDFGNGEIVNIRDTALPEDKIYPWSLSYRYQLQKNGQLPSRWSPKESIHIRLEPPRSSGVHLVPEKLKRNGKVPVRVQFTPVLFAKSYEVQLADNSSFDGAQSLVGVSSAREFEVEMKQDYFWKVRALDQNGKPLSAFSEVRRLSSNEFMKQIQLAQAQRAKDRAPAQADSRAESRAALNQMDFEYRMNRFWAWLGSGFSYVNYQQSIAERGAVDSASRNEMPGQYFEVGYVGDQGYGAIFGYKNTPGEVIVENAPLAESKYNWRTVSLEGMALSRSRFSVFGLPIYYGPRVGLQSHNIPYMFLNSLDSLELKQNDMITASLGVMAEAPRNRWRFHSYLRYQYPLTATSGGANEFSIKPKFAFDGLVGTSYYFSSNFKVGAFWYGQWHYYDFVYGDALITNSGNQSLFYSTMDLRFGFEF